MIYVIDACALIAFLSDEQGADAVDALLEDSEQQCIMHAVNACEVFYDSLRQGTEAEALQLISTVNGLGIVVKEDLDYPFWQSVGRLKVAHRISLADCFALALTMRVGGVLVTSDHHEFDPLATASICPISFIR